MAIVRTASKTTRKIFTTSPTNKQKVAPEKIEEGGDDALPDSDDKSQDKARAKICVCVTLIISITEASSMFISTMYWGVLKASPGLAGSSPIPLKQNLANLAVMLIGELFVTGAVIAYVTRHSKRYLNDPAKEWATLREKKRLLIAIAVIMAVVLSVTSCQVPSRNCFLSVKGEKEIDWVLTMCPAVPENGGDMIWAWGEKPSLSDKHHQVGSISLFI